MTRTNTTATSLLLCLALFGLGCLKDESLDTNRVPDAHARAVGSNGQVVDATVDGGLAALMFPFDGDPIEVTLDGLASRDLDGKVVAFDWRYVAPATDGGVPPMGGFWNQSPTLDPNNEARPKVNLPMGVHTFALWVTDDDGAVSPPDTITLNVGADPAQQCIDDAYEMLDDACASCVCGAGAACPAAVPACGHDCWGLIGCIASMCPNFNPATDTQCVIDNCIAFIGGMTGASAAGACIAPNEAMGFPGCATECTPSITTIVTSGPMGG